jgi:HSP20 family protein
MAIEISRPRWGLARSPFGEMTRMERDMEDMLGRFFGGWPRLRREAENMGWSPAIDVVDRKDELLLRADLPGLTEKDIDITVQDGVLSVQGQRKEEKETKEEDYYCSERWSGSFYRSLTLPTGINADKISASFKNGVLEVHLPKTKQAEGKKVEVKAA